MKTKLKSNSGETVRTLAKPRLKVQKNFLYV